MYNYIFKNILNDDLKSGNYTSSIELKNYKALWRDYADNIDKQYEYFSNIHLSSLIYLDQNIGLPNNNSKNMDKIIKLFDVFEQVSRDYLESPLEFNKENYHLEESLKLIIHTLTHTVINYLYFTIIKMIIKQIEESHGENLYGTKRDFQNGTIKYLKQILDNTGSNTSELIEYLFEIMPEKLVKITLGIYDTEADPYHSETIDSVFTKIISIIRNSSKSIINADNDSELISNLNAYIIPYYKEYTKIIILELYELTNNFFKHLIGMHNLLKIHKNLN